jgi:uncharacterized protein YbaA (DUF1428 family)
VVKFIDVYLLPVPRRNLAAYRRFARSCGRMMKDHGVLTYREFVAAEGGEMKGMPALATLAKPRAGEVVVCAFTGFRSRAHRDRVNAAVAKDPRMARAAKAAPPFDPKRARVGGFDLLLMM